MIPRFINPFNFPGPQPDSPHSSSIEYDMAIQTASLYYRNGGNCHHFVFPHYNKAAIATIVGTGRTKFKFTGDSSEWCYAQFPWHHQAQFGGIRALMRVVTDHDMSFSLRLSSNDLVDAVAESIGDASPDAYISRDLTDAGWTALNTGTNNGFKMLEKVVDLRTPTLPANNRIVIFPEIEMTQDYTILTALSGGISVYLHSLVLFDVPESEVG